MSPTFFKTYSMTLEPFEIQEEKDTYIEVEGRIQQAEKEITRLKALVKMETDILKGLTSEQSSRYSWITTGKKEVTASCEYQYDETTREIILFDLTHQKEVSRERENPQNFNVQKNIDGSYTVERIHDK